MTKDTPFKSIMLFILNALKPFKLCVSVMLLNSVVWATAITVQPYILKIILNDINEVQGEAFMYTLMWPCIAYIIVGLIKSCVNILYNYAVDIKMTPQLRKNIANSSLARLIEHSHSYYQNNFAGTLASNINNLTDATPNIIKIAIDSFFSEFMAVSIAVYALWQVNVAFAILMLIWSILTIGFSLLFSKKLALLSADFAERSSKITGKFVDVFSNILSVRLFAKQNYEKAVVNNSINEAATAEANLEWLYLYIWGGASLIFVTVQGLNIYLLLIGVHSGSLSVGDFALVITINIRIFEALRATSVEFSRFGKLYGRINQALRSVAAEPEIQDELNAKDLLVLKAGIEFCSIKFQYNNFSPLFDNLSVAIHPKQKVGLVGYSGSGKTTFVNLILRLYDLNEGSIKIDGQDISEIKQNSLRENVSIIPQDPHLFHRSLKENICYGKIGASDAQIIDASIKAHAHEFIANIPEGYQALVGERGVKLSGGQRQRIAIARAILKNAPILILDEATSQLDSITEGYIQESISSLMEDKTTIVVAHRLSTLLNMDRILVFDKGRIVEDGSHTDLILLNGVYKKLWDAQVDGFLPN